MSKESLFWDGMEVEVDGLIKLDFLGSLLMKSGSHSER